ncbi:MAG TPA: isochorismatase family cysteine hydrolase [Acidimicrobiales bacterium]|jgi:nicotinamidase-related amidase|nr:isochorismatase family cysteine hydrolase [Acidimicrobiales bacterium]
MVDTALLVMDVQNGIVARLQDGAAPLLERVGSAITAARGAEIPVIYVRVAFRPGMPEISARNAWFSAVRTSTPMGLDDDSTQVHPQVAPEPDDIVVIKKRVSAFTGSDLALVLRSLDVDSLVLTGISTSGVVLSTLRQAADLDFRLTVLRDACGDADPEVHRVLLDKVFPRQAAVVTVAEWAAQVEG